MTCTRRRVLWQLRTPIHFFGGCLARQTQIMLACRRCACLLPYEGQWQLRALLHRKGLPLALVTWLCCTFGLDAQFVPQMRQRWAFGPIVGALRGYSPADRHRFRPQDFPRDR